MGNMFTHLNRKPVIMCVSIVRLDSYICSVSSNVDEVVRFSGQAQRKQLTYATKQLIGREVSYHSCSQSKFTMCGCALFRLRWRR